MRYTTVFILVTATLADVLIFRQSLSTLLDQGNLVDLTDFTTGPFAITVVLKLNGPAGVVSLAPFCIAVVGSADRGSKLKEAFVGLSRS